MYKYRPFSSLGYFRKSCESTWRTCINLYCVTLTYVRLRSGHMTQEKGLILFIIINFDITSPIPPTPSLVAQQLHGQTQLPASIPEPKSPGQGPSHSSNPPCSHFIHNEVQFQLPSSPSLVWESQSATCCISNDSSDEYVLFSVLSS